MNRNKRVTIFLTLVALSIIGGIGFVMYMLYGFGQTLAKAVTEIQGTNEERFLGKKKIDGTENLYIKFYQTDKFDMATPLDYEVVDHKDSIVIRKSFLVGTHDKEEDITSLYAKVYDSILYISYINPNKVWKVQDLKSVKSRENLFQTLKLHDSTLVEM